MPEVCWQRLIFTKKELHPAAGESELSLEGPGGLTSLYQSPLAPTMPSFPTCDFHLTDAKEAMAGYKVKESDLAFVKMQLSLELGSHLPWPSPRPYSFWQ